MNFLYSIGKSDKADELLCELKSFGKIDGMREISFKEVKELIKQANKESKERYEKYIEENCKNCKNKDKDLCEIRISCFNNIITTKCVYYEREN